ncbi:MAG: four helix bundle protein [Hyphomicrobiaceae bacterium]
MSDSGIQSYRDLQVWQKSIALSVACYRLTAAFPRDELYGMTSQIRRSSASVPANIAEGHGREHTRSFIQFLRVAQGSLKELETHLVLAEQVGLTTSASLEPLFAASAEIGRMVRALIRSLQSKIGDME